MLAGDRCLILVLVKFSFVSKSYLIKIDSLKCHQSFAAYDFYKYSKTCHGRPLKDKTKILMKNGSLMKVKSIAKCLEHSAILLTCIKR